MLITPGMGNRFREMAGYHTLIIVHGVIATIVFLGLVPMSILIIRYYSRWNPYWAFKLHAWCQVLTLLLTTVVFVLGWFAVGPKRSLSNPHHGIGLAIYVMVIFQVFWGWLVHKMESKRKRHHVPLKLVVCLNIPGSFCGANSSDTSMAWPRFGYLRDCSDSFGPHPLRFTKIAFHPVRAWCVCIPARAFYPILPVR